jgi:hypothetical protein
MPMSVGAHQHRSVREAAPKHVAAVRTKLFDPLDSRDLAQLDSILERVIARIDS